MNIAIWVLAGGVLGWIGYAILKINRPRGMIFSIVVGAIGGFAGGNVLAPLLGAAVETPNDFSLFSMIIALACAAGLLAVGNLVSNHFKV